ncbi:hypothetical protein [Clostridium sp.]|uniref:hypothetical protein n=1 Tax=Clostridium sp. TaxID=1506 RepID=UPI0032169916
MKRINKLVSAITLLGILSAPTIANASGYTVSGYYVNSGSSVGYTLEAWADTYSDRRVSQVLSTAYADNYTRARDTGYNWSKVNIRNMYVHGTVYNAGQDSNVWVELDTKNF